MITKNIDSPSPSSGPAFLLWPLLARLCRFLTLGVCDSVLLPGDPPGPVCPVPVVVAGGICRAEGADVPSVGWCGGRGGGGYSTPFRKKPLPENKFMINMLFWICQMRVMT